MNRCKVSDLAPSVKEYHMKRGFWISALLILSCVFLFNCVGGPPPLDPNDPTNPNTKLPDNPDITKTDDVLKRNWQLFLPREMDALFVLGNQGYACTREGSIYTNGDLKNATYTVTSVNLATGKRSWQLKGTACVLDAAGGDIYSSRFADDKKTVIIDVIDVATGEIKQSLKATHDGCGDNRISGPGERMFVKQPFKGFGCFGIEAVSGKIVFTNDYSAQVFDPASGKLVWQQSVGDKIGRVSAATVNGDTVYVVYASKELAANTITPKDTSHSDRGYEWKYQLAAFDMAGNTSKWNVGPFPGHIIQSKLEIKGGALIAQMLRADKSSNIEPAAAPAAFGPLAWTAHFHVHSFDVKSGNSNWDKSFQESYAKASNHEAPSLDKSHLLKGQLYVSIAQSKPSVASINALTGTGTWRIAIQVPQSNNVSTKTISTTTPGSQIFSLSDEYLHIRNDMGTNALVATGKEINPPSLQGVLVMHAASPEMVTSEPSQPKTSKKPKQVVTATGFCNRMDGTSMPMSDVRTESRFFLPLGRSYYGPNQFWSAFCADYQVNVKAFEFAIPPSNKSQWETKVFVPEAPVFVFMRADRMFVLSDNGDWYGFKLK